MMVKKYFIFNTEGLDPRVYMMSLEEPYTARYNNDRTKVILTSLVCEEDNELCPYYQGTQYTYEEILEEIEKPEWQGEI